MKIAALKGIGISHQVHLLQTQRHQTRQILRHNLALNFRGEGRGLVPSICWS